MEFEINSWLEELSLKIKKHFRQRVLFIGYHGSYRRGEATADSDIDMVVILDELNFGNLADYKKIIKSMPFSEKACGFISGKKEIENWSKSDLFQFLNETKPLFGDLHQIITPLNKEEIKQAVKSSAETLYHATCHAYLFDKNLKESLCGLYKATFFILQAQYYLEKDIYIPTKRELREHIKESDRLILDTCINKDKICTYDNNKIDKLYEVLIKWCSNKITIYL